MNKEKKKRRGLEGECLHIKKSAMVKISKLHFHRHHNVAREEHWKNVEIPTRPQERKVNIARYI